MDFRFTLKSETKIKFGIFIVRLCVLSCMVDIEVETRTVEREIVVINDSEYPASVVLDFLNKLEGTDGFLSGIMCSGLDSEVAEELSEIGVVSHTHSSGYYVEDSELFEEVRDEIIESYQ